MQTKTIIGGVLAVAIAAGAWYMLSGVSPVTTVPASYKDGTYIIEGQPVTLVDGRAEVESAPGSASKTITQYFGNEATGDLNGDGVADTVFLVTQTGGGSGTFYYVVAAIKTSEGYIGTSAASIGDRIAPQTTEIRDGQLIVNYATRRSGESFTTAPSEGKSLYLKLDPVTFEFGEVVQNFEGESAVIPR